MEIERIHGQIGQPQTLKEKKSDWHKYNCQTSWRYMLEPFNVTPTKQQGKWAKFLL